MRDAPLTRARDRLLAGEREGLERLLRDEPELVTHRLRTAEVPYDGYFHGATLLHHVAGNPLIRELPDGIVELTRLVVDRGAEVDAVTLQGPSQPDDIGWTTLGLVATSAEARRAGCQRDLMDVLIAAGANVDARDGGCIMGALYYGESGAAEYLAARGARLDLVAAAGVGHGERVRTLLGAEPFGGHRLAHCSRVPWPEDAGRADLLGLALLYAALHGRSEVIELLLDAGADPNHRPPFDHRGTALHWAVMGDRADAVRCLLEAGADPGLRDLEHDSTPAGWAEHLGRRAAARALGPAGSGHRGPPDEDRLQ